MQWAGAAICLILVLLRGTAAASEKPSGFSETILAGLDSLYNLEIDGALARFTLLTSLDSTHPAGPFYTAVALATQTARLASQHHVTDETQIASLLDDAVRRGQARLAAMPTAAGHTTDPTVHLVLAGALAMSGQRAAEQRRYLAAWEATKASYAHLLEAARHPAGQAEAAYGLGMLHYSLAGLSGISRVLVGWLFIIGDHDRGLQELERAAHEATYTRMAARIELAHLYATRERRYEAALPYAVEAARRYPNNPDMAFLLANTYSELGRSVEAMTVATRIRERLEAGTYETALWPRYEQLLGKIALDRGALAEAREHFTNAFHVHDDQYLWVKAWAVTRLGMVEDLEGHRAAALARYRETLALQSGGAAEEAARQGLRTPYVRPVSTSTASGR